MLAPRTPSKLASPIIRTMKPSLASFAYTVRPRKVPLHNPGLKSSAAHISSRPPAPGFRAGNRLFSSKTASGRPAGGSVNEAPNKPPDPAAAKAPERGRVSAFATEFVRIVKEELLNIRSYKKKGKTYAKIDKEVLEKSREKAAGPINRTATAVQEVKRKKSFWEKWVSRARRTETYGKYRGYSEQFYRYAKSNPHFQKFEELHSRASNAAEDLREAYETTQNPLVWKLRDLGDRMTSENDTAFALRRVAEIEPDFSAYDFLNELKMHILPVIIQSVLNCDLEFAKQTCEGNAFKTVYAYSRAREQSELDISGQLIDVLDAEFLDATVHNRKSMLNFSCIGQHLETAKSKAPKPGETPTYFVKNIYYKLALTPDRECPIFGWKFVDIQMQQIYALKS